MKAPMRRRRPRENHDRFRGRNQSRTSRYFRPRRRDDQCFLVLALVLDGLHRFRPLGNLFDFLGFPLSNLAGCYSFYSWKGSDSGPINKCAVLYISQISIC